MSKALQKHMVSHLPEGAEGDGGDTTAKAQLKKDDGKKMSMLRISHHCTH